MKHIDVDAIREQSSARFAFLTDFCRFGADDWAGLDASLPFLAPVLPDLLDRLYEHLLAYDDTRRIFLGPQGELDPQYIELRKEHMTEWIMTAMTIRDADKFASYVTRVGRRHRGVAGQPDRAVPPRYMVALMGFLQTEIASALFATMAEDPAGLQRSLLAWNKILMIQLEMFLKATAPGWPSWDEA